MRTPTTARRLPAAAAGLLVLAGLLAGCGGKAKPTAATSAPTSAPSSEPTTSAPPSSSTPPPPPPVNPLTGVGPVPQGGVVAVKIDDTANARPMHNIDKADVVYVEQVEGGLTRLLAVYAANKPTVASVRSVRFADPELLGAYGRITFVASGGAPEVLAALDHSVLHGDINDRGGPGFSRMGCCAPYNLAADLAAISQAVPGDPVKDVGFTWGALSAGAASAPAVGALNTVVGGTAVGFVWDAGLNRWVRVINGRRQATADNVPVATPNVIVQFCDVQVDPRDVDVAGNPSSYTHSIGSGPVAVFRDGRRIDGTWTRADQTSPTSYVDAAGQPIPLAPGGAWVVLVAKGAPLTTG